jgi:calcium-binding protein CML
MIKRVDEFVKHLDNPNIPKSRKSLMDTDSDHSRSIRHNSSVMIKTRVQAAFDTMYRNGDGQLDENEFGLLMEKLRIPVTHEMGHKIVKALDIDGDGVIDVDELEVFYKAIMTDAVSPHDMAKDLFSVFDLDGDGYISPNEFVRTLEGLKLGFSAEDTGHILQEVDEDGDGIITFLEFERVIEEYMPAELFSDYADEVDEELAVHPFLTVVEGLCNACQNCISFGTGTHRRRNSVQGSDPRRSILDLPSPVLHDPIIPQGVDPTHSYGSLLDSIEISEEESD